MPIYEFKCSKCNHFFELLVMKNDDQVEMKCPECNSEDFERVLSATNYSFGVGSTGASGVSSQTRNCSSGSCTTYDIPGHTR